MIILLTSKIATFIFIGAILTANRVVKCYYIEALYLIYFSGNFQFSPLPSRDMVENMFFAVVLHLLLPN